MRLLEEFWFGNIEPTEYDTSSCKEYKKGGHSMIVAIDKDFNRIHIEDAVVKQECYCPYCGERLSQKRYTDRVASNKTVSNEY